MQQILAPSIYIKSNFTFTVPDNSGMEMKEFSYLNQPVSIFGLSGLRWVHFDPIDRVGDSIKVKVDVLAKTRFSFATEAYMLAEITNDATYLGMKFLLNDFERTRLAAAIKNEGYYPTNYIRKYPRIPALDTIVSMPQRAIVQSPDGTLIVFDIANMSPNGILLATENPKAITFLPGQRMEAQVEPRGAVGESFDFEGMICRVVMDKNPKTKNITRMLGIRFMKMDPDQKDIFEQVLKSVIANIQLEGMVK